MQSNKFVSKYLSITNEKGKYLCICITLRVRVCVCVLCEQEKCPIMHEMMAFHTDSGAVWMIRYRNCLYIFCCCSWLVARAYPFSISLSLSLAPMVVGALAAVTWTPCVLFVRLRKGTKERLRVILGLKKK